MTADFCLASVPYSDLDLLDDCGLVSDDSDSDLDSNSKSCNSDAALLVSGSAVGLGVYALARTQPSRAVTAQITTMVTDLTSIVDPILVLAIAVFTVYYAFRITGRLMP